MFYYAYTLTLINSCPTGAFPLRPDQREEKICFTVKRKTG